MKKELFKKRMILLSNTILFISVLFGGVSMVWGASHWREANNLFRRAEKMRLSSSKPALKGALKLYFRACRWGHGRSCWRVGYMMELHPDLVSQKIKGPSQQYFHRACRLRDGEGCNSLARYHSMLSKKSKKILPLYRKACHLRSGEGCYNYLKEKAFIYKKMKLNAYRAKRWRRERRWLRKRALHFLRFGCRRKLEKDCFLLGHFYFGGYLVKKDELQALYYLRKGCRYFFADACDYLGIIEAMRGKRANDEQAFLNSRQAHRKACQLGSLDGCVHLAGLFFRGLGGAKDLVGARRLFRRSCHQKHALACLLYGEMLLRGEGGDRDLKLGFKIYKKSCSLGNQEACRRVKAIEKVLR